MHSRWTETVFVQVMPQLMPDGCEVTVPTGDCTMSLRSAVSVRDTGSKICSIGLHTGGSAEAGPADTASAARAAQSAASTRRRDIGVLAPGLSDLPDPSG